jgi:hypothetical protein
MIRKLEQRLQRDFKSNYVTYWNNLSRLTNMLIISNFSLFFLTELVTRDRYYYTHLSPGFLFIVQIGLILPPGVLETLAILTEDDRSGISGRDWYGDDIWQVFEKHHPRFKKVFDGMQN